MTEKALKTIESNGYDLFSDARIELIRSQVANGAPDNLFVAMIEIAKVRGLDPLAKQISLINFGGTWQITTTIDGYRALAEQTGAYAGSDAATFTHADDMNKPHTATVTVWKLVQGHRVAFTATVYYAEYKGRAPIWSDKPFTMLGKVAESHALRKAFPSTLSGMYTTDEMAQAGPIQSGEVIDHDTGEIVQATSRAVAAPPTNVPAQTALVDQKALSAIHAVKSKRKVNDDDLHAIARHRYGVESLKELSVAFGRDLYKLLDQEDDDALASIVYEATREPGADDDPGELTLADTFGGAPYVDLAAQYRER